MGHAKPPGHHTGIQANESCMVILVMIQYPYLNSNKSCDDLICTLNTIV